MLIYLIVAGYFAVASAILWRWIGPNFWTFILAGTAVVILIFGYYHIRRNERKGEFRLSVVSVAGVDKVYLGWKLWGIAKESAREEKRHSHSAVHLFEKINGRYSRVDFSRYGELKKTIKEVFRGGKII